MTMSVWKGAASAPWVDHDPREMVWATTGNTTMAVEPRGLGGFLYVPVITRDGSIVVVRSDDSFQLDTSVTGAGGIHDDHSLANSTLYDVRFCVGRPSGVAAGAVDGGLSLFFLPTGTTVNAAKIASLGNGTWVGWSRVAAICKTDGSGNLITLSTCGHMRFKLERIRDWWRPLNAGTATSATAINLTNHVPSACCAKAIFTAIAVNTGATARQVQMRRGTGASGNFWFTESNIAAGAGNSQQSTRSAELNVRFATTLTNILAYLWSGSVTGGLTLYVDEIWLR